MTATLTKKKGECPFCVALENFKLEKEEWHNNALELANVETLKEVQKVINSGTHRSHAELFAYYFPDSYRKHYERIEHDNPPDKIFYKCLTRMSADTEFRSLCCEKHIQVWKRYQ